MNVPPWSTLVLAALLAGRPAGAVESAAAEAPEAPEAAAAAEEDGDGRGDAVAAGPSAPRSRRLDEVLDRARRLVGHRSVVVAGRRFSGDCSNFVRAVYSAAGVDLMRPPPGAPVDPGPSNGVRSVRAFNRARGVLGVRSPEPGDLVYFDDTYDRNRNGRVDDPLTHVGLVDRVLPGGTVEFIHFSAGRVRRARLTCARAHESGKAARLNDPVRVQRPRDPPGTRYLASELLVDFGRIDLAPAAAGDRR
ncbi:MAG: hypothetical protein RL199_944 [Pseudomonadota bacterium]|jgi:hypothetical protein